VITDHALFKLQGGKSHEGEGLDGNRRKVLLEFSTLNSAAQPMWDNGIGCIPVVDKGGHVIGILTGCDICMAAYTQGVPLPRRTGYQRHVEAGIFLCAG
jgi:hypothetical protein